MQAFFVGAALVVLAAVVPCLYRVLRGPSIIDRILGVNVIGTKTIAVILLVGCIFDRVEFFVDIALVYALISFVGTLALSKYFERKAVLQREATR